MELGIHVVTFDHAGGTAAIAPTLARVGEVTEAVGATSLSVDDLLVAVRHPPVRFGRARHVAGPRRQTWT
jgi:hypothetical protein